MGQNREMINKRGSLFAVSVLAVVLTGCSIGGGDTYNGADAGTHGVNLPPEPPPFARCHSARNGPAEPERLHLPARPDALSTQRSDAALVQATAQRCRGQWPPRSLREYR